MVRDALLFLVLMQFGYGGRAAELTDDSRAAGGNGYAANGGAAGTNVAAKGGSGSFSAGGALAQSGATGTAPVRLIPITSEQYAHLEASACLHARDEVNTKTVEWVIDASSSMAELAPGTASRKWEITRRAVLDAIPGISTAPKFTRTSTAAARWLRLPRALEVPSGT